MEKKLDFQWMILLRLDRLSDVGSIVRVHKNWKKVSKKKWLEAQHVHHKI